MKTVCFLLSVVNSATYSLHEYVLGGIFNPFPASSLAVEPEFSSLTLWQDRDDSGQP